MQVACRFIAVAWRVLHPSDTKLLNDQVPWSLHLLMSWPSAALLQSSTYRLSHPTALHQSHVHLRGIVATSKSRQTLLIPDPNRELCFTSALVLSLLCKVDFCGITRQDPILVTFPG